MRLLNSFIKDVIQQQPFCLESCSQDDLEFLAALKELPTVGGSEFLIQGQHLLCKIVAGYPHLMPLLPRDLLWFFGGDCLHYMPDEEIGLFQRLDESRDAARISDSAFSYEKARANIFGLH
ncbi:MAG: dehydrogenase [Proteobacteria bacterium]|nr:MAG: dehydrogenase [Pseudomonadota bacterium]